MKIITVDGKEWNVKYQKNKESISFDVGTTVSNYPNFTGSKLNQNSSSSDKYSLSFAVPKTQVVSFRESFKKYVVDESKAVTHPTYGKLTHIILEHLDWGAIKGSITSSPSFNTSSESDILVNCTFQEHTPDNPELKRDFEVENDDAETAIDNETAANFDVDLDGTDKAGISGLADSLDGIYKDIQNSSVVQAFNDLNSELNKAILDSKRIMSSVKNIINLPNLILFETRNKIDIFQQQSTAIKNVPVTSYNMAIFNVNSLSYNSSSMSKIAYNNEGDDQEISGIKTVPLD